jgi:hypothetical protein
LFLFLFFLDLVILRENLSFKPLHTQIYDYYWDNSMFLESLFLSVGAKLFLWKNRQRAQLAIILILLEVPIPFFYTKSVRYLPIYSSCVPDSKWFGLEFGSHKQAVITRNW